MLNSLKITSAGYRYHVHSQQWETPALMQQRRPCHPIRVWGIRIRKETPSNDKEGRCMDITTIREIQILGSGKTVLAQKAAARKERPVFI